MGTILVMAAAKKFKPLSIDDRGRITLPPEIRKRVDSFDVVSMEAGTIKLIPLKALSLQDAELIESLKSSAKQFKAGKTVAMPKEFLK